MISEWKLLSAVGLATISNQSLASPYTTFVTTQANLYKASRPNVANYPLASATGLCPGMLTYTNAEGAIVISGDGSCTISGKKFVSTNQAYAIEIVNHKSGTITISNNYFTGNTTNPIVGAGHSSGRGIQVLYSDDVTIDNNHFENNSFAAVYVFGDPASGEDNVRVTNNKILNTQLSDTLARGPVAQWRYQAYGISFLNINGAGNTISGNRVINEPGKSFQTDVFNLYQSSGTSVSALKIEDNVVLSPGSGGYYNSWGAGLQIGDHASGSLGGQFVIAKSNLFSQPGMAGINVNGGIGFKVLFNIIYSTEQIPGYIVGATASSGTWAVSPTLYSSIALFNYLFDGTPHRDHILKGNRMYCPTALCEGRNVTNIYSAQNPMPTGTSFIDNNYNDPQLGYSALVSGTQSFMNGQSCAQQIIGFGGDQCYAKTTVKSHNSGMTIQQFNAANQLVGQAWVTCVNGRWRVDSEYCAQ